MTNTNPAPGEAFLGPGDEAVTELCGAVARNRPSMPLRQVEQTAAELARSRRAAYVALCVSCGSEPESLLDSVVAELLEAENGVTA